jgi:hypothetical protein
MSNIPGSSSFSSIPNTVGDLLLQYRKGQLKLAEGFNGNARALNSFRQQVADNKKIAKELKDLGNLAKGNRNFLNNLRNSGLFKFKGGNLFGAGAVGVLLGTALIQQIQIRVQGEINDIFSEAGNRTGRELDIISRLNQKFAARISALEKLNSQLRERLNNGLSQQARALYDTNQRTVAADKKANDALYEARQGRKIVDAKIEQNRKGINDALYEIRGTKQRLENAINSTINVFRATTAGINQQIATTKNQTVLALNRAVSAEQRVNTVNQQLINLGSNLTQTRNSLITALNTSQQDNRALNSTVAQLKQRLETINTEVKSIPPAIKASEQNQQQVTTKIVLATLGTFAGQQETRFRQEFTGFNARINEALLLQRQQGLRFDEAFRQVELKQRQQDEEIAKRIGLPPQLLERVNSIPGLRNDLDAIKTNLPSQIANNPELQKVKKDIEQTKKIVTPLQTNIEELKKQQKEADKVNQVALGKLDNIAQIASLIPARTADRLKKDIPSIPQIEQAAATGVCRTTQPGGCMNKALNDNATDIKNNSTNNAGNILDAVNAVGQGIDLGMLNTINNKLGDQIPGGLTGGFSRLYRLLQIDRVLNILTYINTLHNAFMLSNNIGQTLFSAFDNIAEFAGFKWKNEKDEEVSFSEIVGDFTENFFKSLFGEENYNAMVTTYKKANRIYQAGANILNSARSMIDSVRNIGEFTAENTGRIGNALRKFGVVGENAYKAMPEQVNAQSAWVQRLNNLEEAASGIEMVTSELASITQNVNEIREQKEEFEKSITDSPTKEQKENTAVKAAAVASKSASPGQDLSEEDKESDE